MKTKILFIYLSLTIGATHLSQAGNVHQDTLILKMPNGVMVEQLVSFRHPSDVEVFTEFKSYLSSFLQQFDKLETNALNEQQPMRIEFYKIKKHYNSNEYSISFEDYKPKTKITIIEENNLHHINQRIHLLVLSNNSKFDDFKAHVHFTDIDQLRELVNFDFEKINQDLLNKYQEKEYNYLKRKPFSSWITVNDKSETELNYNLIADHPTDLIQLSAGTGLDNLKGEWLGSFNAKATLIFTQKMVDKHSISVAYQWMYNFTSPSEKYVNDFIDIGYAYNFSSMPDKDKWAGINFGFLARRKGEFFAKNTFRLGLYTNVSKSITVGPQMYFNDFFKNVYPGVNLSISIL